MSVRRLALEALRDITEKGAWANLRLRQAQAGLERRDAAWVSSAVYTVLDNIGYIDFAISKYAKGKVDKAVKAVLRLGIAQACFMNTPSSAACNESVKLAKEIGKGSLSGYVNGVLRTVVREGLPELPKDPVKRMCIEYSCPEFMVTEFCRKYGESFTAEMLGKKLPGTVIRAQYPFTKMQLEAALADEGIEFEQGRLDPEALIVTSGVDVVSLPLFKEGKGTVQSESAMAVCRAAQVKENMKVLDCCCAPGGKSAFIASLMKNTGSITGWELHEHRCELANNTFKRLNVANAAVEARDASVLSEEYRNVFDVVLIDAPCSGFGVTGKPDVRLNRCEEDVLSICAVQKNILDACCEYVKPGGRLVYATCTVSERENEAQTLRFLETHKEFVPADTEWMGERLSARSVSGGVQLFPNLDGTDGFYVAAFDRK